jgi:uncharacterized LabA/DUF88 family protein
VDRCALFVDAGYMLADGAMAVHGTRRGESVSWDYEGLLQLLSSLARERSGLPLLRCYWYEATVDGRRTAEHDALADVPGIKLRVAKIRPGRREGVETEIHRDLTTLARNNAISDALVISAEEDLAQVIADVQDLGLRVTLVHIAVDGNWTISRALRQESDDIIEISGEHLRPYVELIAGAEPVHDDEQAEAPERGVVVAEPVSARSLSNGHSAGGGSYQPLPGPANHAPPAIYTAPVVAEYQRPTPQLPRTTAREPREPREPRETRELRGEARELRGEARELREIREAREPVQPRDPIQPRDPGQPREPVPPREVRDPWEERPREAVNGEAQTQIRPEGYSGPDPYTAPEAGPAPGGQLRRLPARSAPSSPGPMGASASVPPGGGSNGGPARSAPYSGPQPIIAPAGPGSGGYQPPGGSSNGASLAEAVQAAHEEGQEFGGSVARDAPALWLEAVLARKPRMPSDLEARLLQGSALPIDFLLHDEVRHALRRGFWDALERTRR